MQACMNFHGRFIPTRVTSSSRMCPLQLIYSTPHCTVRLPSYIPPSHSLEADEACAIKVRCISSGGALSSIVPRVPPFLVLARHNNVFLETIKRGDLDDAKGICTIVMRFYEAYGGHASIGLHINMPKRIVAAYETNLLEDDAGAKSLALERTTGEWSERRGDPLLRLVFRGFEVKTIKVVLAKDG
jgi:alpha-mannosidase